MSPETESEPSLKIFLVEDSEDARVMLTQLLQWDGFQVFTAGTMEAALADFRLSGSEVLVSDLQLPDGDGWELLNKLREAGSAPYAIAMSGYGTLADIDASKKAGFRHHLVKPIELDALERLLEEARREVRRAQ